ncbi:MAG: xylan 1,4-beta-xylosidase [Actinomycetota bacterium]|nr:xylan 1,4-beta-xylosidase [Actinomycetota bacterium]
MTPISPTADAGRDVRADWERRIYRRLTDTTAADPQTALPAPRDVRAQPRSGYVLLSWTPVPGAAGYLIERTHGDGEPHIVAHGGSDVPAVPGDAFADTGLDVGTGYRYRVGAVAGAEFPVWNWSEPVLGRIGTEPAGAVQIAIDASDVTGELQRVWRMVGSERLTQLMFGRDEHGHEVGAEFAEALRRAHDDLGVRHVRAHAILHDDNGVVTQAPDGGLRYDFAIVDRLYDAILAMGLRPVVELSFMPAALSADPQPSVFTYRGLISPPKDWAQWRALVTALAAHLVERYGIDEVAQWGFEVWNEPNLEVFWTGTRDDYFRLYAEAARAVKSVDPRLLVGGPSTAAAEWIEPLAEFAAGQDLPLDFVTSHTYGNLPLDAQPALQRHGFDKLPIWWTEWGVGSTHFGPIHDGVIGAPFILSGFTAVQNRMDALAYWVISDHFEELGRPPRLFHNGFGLLTVGNLRKPRYWAVHLAAHAGDHLLAAEVSGDGAGVLVQTLATRHEDGTVDVLVWNGTINGQLMDGDPRLDRRVQLRVDGLAAGPRRARIARVDAAHSNILAGYPEGVDWPDAALWEKLRAADHLDEHDLPDAATNGGPAQFDFVLPMPGIARIRLLAGANTAGSDEETSR